MPVRPDDFTSFSELKTVTGSRRGKDLQALAADWQDGCMLRLLLALVLLAPLSVSLAAPPNIVMIISDDHAWTDYGFMGHPIVATPHLDKLASQSLTFKNGYVPSSLCCPSLATMITGKFPHQHRITGNDPAVDQSGPVGRPKLRNPAFAAGRERMKALIRSTPTLPRLLGTHQGYRSQQTGKWWLGGYADGGFTEGMTGGDPARGGRHGDAGLNIGRKGMEPIYDFIRQSTADQKPFLVWYAPLLPHDPHTPPEALLAKYRDKVPSLHIARYLAMVEWFDQTCGELLGFLDRENLSENTIVVYVADNGWIQNPDNPRYAPRSKQSPYDGGLRTPIMLRWPGKIQPAMPPATAHSIDLMPTLLKASGVAVPEGCPGIDLLDPAAVAARDTIFGDCYDHDMVDFDAPAKSLKWRWCRQGDWKLILPTPRVPDAVPELYNLAVDPKELNNLATSEATRRDALVQRLDAWWTPDP